MGITKQAAHEIVRKVLATLEIATPEFVLGAIPSDAVRPNHEPASLVPGLGSRWALGCAQDNRQRRAAKMAASGAPISAAIRT